MYDRDILSALLRNAAENGIRPIGGVVADWLDENLTLEPIRNEHQGRFPGWLCKVYRSVNRQQMVSGEWTVYESLMSLKIGNWKEWLDHWGVVYHYGVPCLVSEPYLDDQYLDDCWTLFEQLFELTGGLAIATIQRRSVHNPPHTYRITVFANPLRLDEVMAGAGRKTFTGT